MRSVTAAGIRVSRVWLVTVLTTAACERAGPPPGELYRAPSISNVIDGIPFVAGNWQPDLAPGAKGFSRGNHRAVVVVTPDALVASAAVPGGASGPGEAVVPATGAVVPATGAAVPAVRVTIPWRRPDTDPASKAIVVVDSASGETITNALVLRADNASGDIVFQPRPGSSTYHVYYLPWESTGGYYPRVTYPDRVSEPDAAWRRRVLAAGQALPAARTVRIEAVDAFHAFFPMEVIATPAEAATLLARLSGESASAPAAHEWALVPEHRDHPIRMRRFLPYHWIERLPSDTFASRVLRDESFAFQVAVVTGGLELSDIHVAFDGFPDAWRGRLTCFNCGGIDENGRPFTKSISVPAGEVQPLWIGLEVPPDQRPGRYRGTVVVSTRDRGSRSVPVVLDVGEGVARDHGRDHPELMTRLAWLNSTIGDDPQYVIEPFTPVRVEGRSLWILGRRIELGESGLPSAITSYFTAEMTGLSDRPLPILAGPIELEVTIGGRAQRFEPSPQSVDRPGSASRAAARLEIRQQGNATAEWQVERQSEHLWMSVRGRLEYDGMLDYRIALIAKRRVDIDDVVLPVAYVPEAAVLMLGLGRSGGKRPERTDWKWSVDHHQEGVWLGTINRGLQFVLRDENYVRPLNTNFYRNQPLRMPPSWYNDGRGGIHIETVTAGRGAAGATDRSGAGPAAAGSAPSVSGNGSAVRDDAVVAWNYSGPRTMAAGDTIHFNVRFLITPFKPIDPGRHFRTRFVHRYVPVDTVKAWGGTVVNIHHANEINPYINYPFFNLDRQKAYIEEAHAKGIRVKLYYTIRELTYRAWELFALRSLGDEILNDGEGGGHSWLQEHLRTGYHTGWHAYSVDDAAILDKGTSRWTNYYVAGLSWLAANQQIDGLYLDDIAFSRETVKRIVTVLQQERDEVVIDLHSANQFNVRDGFINSALLYMEHFPFITRLWFGEYFDYSRDEDYWMTEVSGLPFGLMGEMLQDGGHPYRGLLYGMTARMYGQTDPRPVWRMMDEFGIAESRMLGYWLEDAPVTTDHPRIPATAYVRPDGVLIVLASWSDRDETIRLELDRSRLGIAAAARAQSPAVEGLQAEADVDLSAVRVPAGQGLFIVIRPR